MSTRVKSGPWVVRLVRAHVRLWLCALLGAAIYAALSASYDWRVVTRLLIAWSITVPFYLAAVAWMMSRTPAGEIRHHAAAQDEGALTLMVLVITAAVASLGAIFVQLVSVKVDEPGFGLNVVHGIATVILSWAFIHTVFALHYAYEFYGEGKRACGLHFPGDSAPDYWDFIYFSFVIGMTFQVSDVAVTNKWIRRTVVCHGALSFFFTTAIIALAVNIASKGF